MWRAAALSVVLCSAQRALAGCSKCSKNLYTGACTGANHKRDCCNDSAGAIAGLVIFIIIVACGCGICVYFCVQQSRSKNVPPPEQQPLMATPAQGQEHIQVMVPAGAGPGTLVSAPHNGQTVQVTVPPGVGPGQYFTVAVPAAAPVATAQGTVVG